MSPDCAVTTPKALTTFCGRPGGKTRERNAQALELAQYEEAKREKKRLREQGIYRGVGAVLVMEPTSSSRIYATGGYATCRIRIEPSGSVSVFSSVGDQGQGHSTTISAIVASPLSSSVSNSRSKSMSDAKKMRTKIEIWISVCESVSMNPADSAVATGTPLRWK